MVCEQHESDRKAKTTAESENGEKGTSIMVEMAA